MTDRAREPLELSLEGGPDAAATARYAVSDRLGAQVDQQAIEDIMLVISELVTNAVRHGGGLEGEPVELRVIDKPDRVRIEVADPRPDAEPVKREQATGVPGGLGLVVVSALCREWGTEREAGRKTVWAEYPLEAGVTVA